MVMLLLVLLHCLFVFVFFFTFMLWIYVFVLALPLLLFVALFVGLLFDVMLFCVSLLHALFLGVIGFVAIYRSVGVGVVFVIYVIDYVVGVGWCVPCCCHDIYVR